MRVSLLFLLVIVFYSVQAQESIRDQVASLFDHLNDTLRPGSSVVVLHDGKEIFHEGFGYANLEHQIKITPQTVFDLASISKQFCGYAIASLIVNGRLSAADDVRKYIPELPDFGQKITIDHLIHHISGIRDWASTFPLVGKSFNDEISFEHILNLAYNQERLNFDVGSEYSYSNTGYNLLAKIVEVITGHSFQTWTKEHIFDMLDMDHSLFLSNPDDIIPKRANGYYEANGTWMKKANMLTAVGSSSMYSSTEDMVKWMEFLANPSAKFVAVVDQMMNRGILNNGDTIAYAYGLVIDEYNGTKRIAHSGSWAGFRTRIAHFPDENLSILVLNNYPTNSTAQVNEISNYFITPNPPPEDPVITSTHTPSITQLEEVLGTYKLGAAWYVTITRDKNQLFTQATSEDRYPMTASNDSVFIVEAYGGRSMTFHKNELGKTVSMTYNKMLCPMVVPDTLSFSAYEGTFYSTELRSEYSIVERDGALIMEHPRIGNFQLTRAFNDDFAGDAWYCHSVEFQRDIQEKIIGMRVTSGRSRNQWFQKMD